MIVNKVTVSIVVSEPDPSHREEEGSGHMPTLRHVPDGMQLCVGN